ncbi:MAG: phosphoglucomutase [Ignavibacteriales bacterium]|nr:phosphoglucomutase [Ignavibacteriales bacterium]
MNIIFGTDGWRGLIDSEVNFENVAIVAQAFSDYINQKFDNPKIVVGYDGRKYSKKFAQLFAQVCSGNKIESILSDGIIPTPVVSFTVKNKKLSAGVMITASHNPAEYNGIKFKAHYGGPFLTEVTLEIEKLLGKSEIKKDEKLVLECDILSNYIKRIKEFVDFNAIKKSNLKILIDSMSGAGQQIIENLLREVEIDTNTIFGIVREDFSYRYAEPIEKNLIPLKDELIKDGKYSFGIANDGDADRVGILLDNGDWLSAQETILLLTDFLINEKKVDGHLVKTSSVTNKLKQYFENGNRKVFSVQVGFKYICEKMLEEDIAFGCEESGGYGYKGHIPERDGILSGLLFIEMLAKSKYKKLSDLISEKSKEFGNIFYDRIDVKYEDEDRINLLPNLFTQQPEKISDFKIVYIEKFLSSRGIINGLKFLLEGDTRWLLIRSSETEPIIRFYAEGQSDEEVQNILSQGINFINKNS